MSLSDTPANIPAAQAMQAVLERALHPTLLQITDGSTLRTCAHAHVQGSHMRIRIAAPACVCNPAPFSGYWSARLGY